MFSVKCCTTVQFDSSSRLRRYSLVKEWNSSKSAKRVAILMQNPNTADEFFFGKTTRNCLQFFSSKQDIGALEIVNVDPTIAAHADLLDLDDVSGDEENLVAIVLAIENADVVVAAWGDLGGKLIEDMYFDVITRELRKFKERGGSVMCLGITNNEEPRHIRPLNFEQMKSLYTEYDIPYC